MDPQALSTAFAWLLVLATALIAIVVIHGNHAIDWRASAAFAAASLLLAVAAVVSATSVLVGGAHISDDARWLIIICRAASSALYLGVAMDLTGRPRFVGRFMERLTR